MLNSDIEKGGLNMIDLKVMQDSFVCKRLAKLMTESYQAKWTWIPNKHLYFVGKDFACLSSTIGLSLFNGLNNIKSDHWKNVITTGLKLNKSKPFTKPQTVCILNNAHITYQNKSLMFETWTKRLTYITDIIENGNIIDFRQIEERIGRSPKLYLEYQVVYNAVTRYLNRHILVDNTTPLFIFTQNNKKPSAHKQKIPNCPLRRHYTFFFKF